MAIRPVRRGCPHCGAPLPQQRRPSGLTPRCRACGKLIRTTKRLPPARTSKIIPAETVGPEEPKSDPSPAPGSQPITRRVAARGAGSRPITRRVAARGAGSRLITRRIAAKSAGSKPITRRVAARGAGSRQITRRPGRHAGTRRAPAAGPKKKKLWIPITAASVAGLLIIVALIFTAGGSGSDKPEKPPPETVKKPEPKPETQKPPKPDPKPQPETLAEKIKRLDARWTNTYRSEADKTRIDYVKEAERFEKLRAEAAGTSDERAIDDAIDQIKDRAAQTAGYTFGAVREKVFRHLKAGEIEEAKLALTGWAYPKTMDVGGVCSSRVQEVQKVITDLEEVERLRSQLTSSEFVPKNAEGLFRRFVESENEMVSEAAERAADEVRDVGALLASLAVLNEDLKARRVLALEHVEQARKVVNEKMKAEAERIIHWRDAMVKGSEASPFKVRDIYPSMTTDFGERDAHVLDFDKRQVVIGGRWGRIALPLDRIPKPVYSRLARWALKGAGATDYLEFGILCVRGGALDRAEQCFEDAKAADASLESILPDVERIRAGIARWNGALELEGDQLKLTYAFEREEEAKDFKPQGAVAVKSSGGKLELTGRGRFFAVMKAASFEREMTLTTTPSDGIQHALGIIFKTASGEYDIFMLETNGSTKKARAKRGPSFNKLKDLAETDLKPGGSISIEWDGEMLAILQGGSRVWSGKLEFMADVRIVVGGVKNASYGPIVLEAGLPATEVQKLHAERSVVTEQELAKVHRITDAEKRAAQSLPKIARFPMMRNEAHPLEEKLKAELPETILNLLMSARLYLTASRTDPVDDADMDAATKNFASVIKAAPRFPLGYYYRAELHAFRGNREAALADLKKAGEINPFFVEAHSARAKLLNQQRDYTEALAALNAALEAVPDLPSVFLERALMQYYQGKNDAALLDLEMAVQLDPSNLGNRRDAKRLRNAVIGPLWNQMVIEETAHYVIMREVPPPPPPGAKRSKSKRRRLSSSKKDLEARMDAYGIHLEAARKWFVEVIGREPHRGPKKPVILIFETAQGYYTYCDFTTADRLENTLGIFHPLYKQLVFFEDADSDFTLRIMSHEGFHQFLDGLVPGAPTWFNEGTAEYLAAVTVEDGKVAKTGLIQGGRLRNLQGAMKGGLPAVPFARILVEPKWMFYRINPSFQYAQAWSMVHFFMEGPNDTYRKIYKEYIKVLLDGASTQEAFEQTFKKADLAEMQKEWHTYVMALKP